ncbi:hypothetical protein WT08_10080 [Burkholderia sp. MSMB1552]|nr:hypothetical protein AQ610_15415 [Burkholderia humptydooensis]KVN13684.1 hypothetical protein WT08_10080 [Burkholderia sp. MSMB1552]KWZ54922.1 hypothetical protein WS92_02620 [Burkholderia sp. MSMB1588]
MRDVRSRRAQARNGAWRDGRLLGARVARLRRRLAVRRVLPAQHRARSMSSARSQRATASRLAPAR